MRRLSSALNRSTGCRNGNLIFHLVVLPNQYMIRQRRLPCVCTPHLSVTCGPHTRFPQYSNNVCWLPTTPEICNILAPLPLGMKRSLDSAFGFETFLCLHRKPVWSLQTWERCVSIWIDPGKMVNNAYWERVTQVHNLSERGFGISFFVLA